MIWEDMENIANIMGMILDEYGKMQYGVIWEDGVGR